MIYNNYKDENVITSKTRYSVTGLLELCDTSKPLPLSKVAESTGIALNYLEQLFRKLRQANIVQSVRGPGGGYQLSLPARAFSVADVALAVEDNFSVTGCAAESAISCVARPGKCRTHTLWQEVSNHMYAHLQGITIDDVYNGNIHPTMADGDLLRKRQKMREGLWVFEERALQ